MPFLPFTPLGSPLIREINNGILTAKNAMPFKDITSDGNASFELGRRLFKKTAVPPVNASTIKIGKMVIQRRALGLSDHQAVISGPAAPLQKRWIGGNHDASQIIKNRRVNAIGRNELNPNGTRVAFKNVSDKNTVRDALVRVRHAGSAAPAKKFHKYANAPAFY